MTSILPIVWIRRKSKVKNIKRSKSKKVASKRSNTIKL